MSKVYQERSVPARVDQICVGRKCDLCGLEAPGSDWQAGSYEVNETTIAIEITSKSGTQYPDGGDTEDLEIDLCPKCFKAKLVPWLQSQGATINPRVVQW